MFQAQDEDFTNEPIPVEAKKEWWQILAVWIGFIIVVGIMAVGGGLTSGMTFGNLIFAVLIGNFILGCLAAISGYIGAESGLSFAQLIENTFPDETNKIVVLYAPITLIGWYAIECAIFGSLVGNVFELSENLTRVFMALSALLFSITCYMGFRALNLISLVFVPLIIILGVYSLFIVNNDPSAVFGQGEKTISFDEGLGLVIGSWALGVVAAYPDIARFAKSPFTGAWLGFLGIFIFNSLALLIGAIAAALTGKYDPALILLATGTPIFAVILGVANIWTTNDSNLYSASLGISRVFSIDRKISVIISALLGLFVAYFNPAQFDIFFKFLGILGTTAPALGGVVFGAYFLKEKMIVTSSIPAWGGWIAGSIVSYSVLGMFSVPLGVITGFVVWYCFAKYLFASTE